MAKLGKILNKSRVQAFCPFRFYLHTNGLDLFCFLFFQPQCLTCEKKNSRRFKRKRLLEISFVTKLGPLYLDNSCVA